MTGYRLYNGTTLHGSTAQTSYTFSGLACGTDYALGLTAVDAAGNESYRPEAVASTSTAACDAGADADAHRDADGNRHGHRHGRADGDRDPAGARSGRSGEPVRLTHRVGLDAVHPVGAVCDVHARLQRRLVAARSSRSAPASTSGRRSRPAPRPLRSAACPETRSARSTSIRTTSRSTGSTSTPTWARPTTTPCSRPAASKNVTIKNSRVGGTTDQKGAVFGGTSSSASLNLVIDNVEFHDVIQRGAEVHNECVFSQSPGLTIRNSTFTNCATMDLFIIRGDWWGQPTYGGVTLENNVFGHSTNGSGWHYYGVYFSNGSFQNHRIVNNMFENSVAIVNQGSGPLFGSLGEQHRRRLELPVRRHLPQQRRHQVRRLRQGHQPDVLMRAARLLACQGPACRLAEPGAGRLPPDGGLDRDRRRYQPVRAGDRQDRQSARRPPDVGPYEFG